MRDLARRAIPLWSTALIAWYVVMLHRWLLPRIVRSGLPFPGAATPPHLGMFAAGLAVLGVAVVATLAAGRGAGRPWVRWLRWGPVPGGWSAAVGWGCLALALLGFGLVGLWYAGVMAILIAPCVTAESLAWVRHTPDPRADTGWWRRSTFFLPAGLMSWVLVLIVLAPETFQDAMRYHLFFPRAFLLEHKYVFVERYFFWSYVSVQQVLYGAGFALGGEVVARAINVALALESLSCTVRLTRLAGMPEADRALAMGLVVSAPGLMLITASAFGEHGCWLPIVLALEAMIGADARSRLPRVRGIAWLVGLAFATKATALFGAAGLVAAWWVRPDRPAWEALIRRHRAPLAMMFAAPWAPWLVMRWLWTGDPVSPHLARAGFPTLDSSSMAALHAYYRFAEEAHRAWLAAPGLLLALPVQFMGGHGGFWEHPGPAITVLALPAVVAWPRLASPVKQLLAFAAASAAAWIALFGGASPHYVMGVTATWTVGLMAVVAGAPDPARRWLRNELSFVVFVLALLSFVAGVFRFGPRDVVFGIVSRNYYLTEGMEPKRVHIPLRQDLAAAAPHRGTVYVLGDDTSYYLGGRVICDYEIGSDPWLWRTAHESADPARLRIRCRQRDITHIVYSTRWPDELARARDETMLFPPATAERLQEFWRRYAVTVAVREHDVQGWVEGSYAFGLANAPRSNVYDATFSRRLPFLPGAGIITYAADRDLAAGQPDKAGRALAGWAVRFGGLAIVQDRLAQVAERLGRRHEAADHRRAALAAGWLTRAPGARGANPVATPHPDSTNRTPSAIP